MKIPLPFHVESFKQQHLEEVLQLFHDTVHAINIRDYSQEQINAWAPEDIDRDLWARRMADRISLIAKINDQIVGFGDATLDGSIEHVYTHKNYQGCGIGTAILHDLERQLRETGIDQVRTEASITAKPFFEHQGYTLVKSQDMVHRSGVVFRNFVMTKKL